MSKFIFLLSFILFISSAQAGQKRFDHCFDTAAERFGVNSTILRAIAYTESRMNPAAIGPTNRNGTYDIGLMQINSIHLPELESFGIKKSDLLNPCVSIHVGAWVLSKKVQRYGNTWNAVGAYNAGFGADRAHLRLRYVNLVKASLTKFQ